MTTPAPGDERRGRVEAPHRGVHLQALHDYLVADHGYTGSCKAVRRYVRASLPRPRLRTPRRVETSTGALGQRWPGATLRSGRMSRVLGTMTHDPADKQVIDEQSGLVPGRSKRGQSG